MGDLKSVFINLWFLPLGGCIIRYRAWQIFELWSLAVAKLQLWSNNKIILQLGATSTWGTVLKRDNIRRAENHCLKWITEEEWIPEFSSTSTIQNNNDDDKAQNTNHSCVEPDTLERKNSWENSYYVYFHPAFLLLLQASDTSAFKLYKSLL